MVTIIITIIHIPIHIFKNHVSILIISNHDYQNEILAILNLHTKKHPKYPPQSRCLSVPAEIPDKLLFTKTFV